LTPDSDAERPLSYEEQVSELFQAGWKIDDIARLTPWTRRALFLPRDDQGRLIRKAEDTGIPSHVKFGRDGNRLVGKRMTLEQVFREANKARGFSDKKIDEGWQAYKDANPKMGKGGDGRPRRKGHKGY